MMKRKSRPSSKREHHSDSFVSTSMLNRESCRQREADTIRYVVLYVLGAIRLVIIVESSVGETNDNN